MKGQEAIEMGSGVYFTLGMGLAPQDPPFLPTLRF